MKNWFPNEDMINSFYKKSWQMMSFFLGVSNPSYTPHGNELMRDERTAYTHHWKT